MRTLYPRQKTLLRLIYLDVDHMTDYDFETIEEWRGSFLLGPDRMGLPSDIWDRIKILKDEGRPHFNEIEFIGGRRGGKGHIGAIIGAYQCFKLLTLDNPQWHYGINPTKDFYTFVTATNLQQAQDFQFADLSNAIANGRCFEKYLSTVKNRWLSLRTPADMRRIADMERRNLPIEREVATIRVVAVSSNSPSSRGAATFALFFDEFAHMLTGTEGPRTGEEVYKALTPSLDQLGKDKLIYAGTSPYCLAPDTRVLTDDLRWVSVGSLSVGDGVVGFDEDRAPGRGIGRAWQRATVTETSLIDAPIMVVKTTGPAITSTPDHRWLVRRKLGQAYQWMRTADLQPGDRIGDIGTWEVDNSRAAGWLAGIYDGEGWVPGNRKQGIWTGVCQNEGTVLDLIRSGLREKGFSFWEHQKERGRSTVNMGLDGGLAEQMRFMGSIRPHRLLPKFLDRLYGSRIYGRQSKFVEVVGVEDAGMGKVVALGTSTNTLMAEGLFSHNTKVGKAYSIYEDGIATSEEDGSPKYPATLIIQLPSWEPYKGWDDLEALQSQGCSFGIARTRPPQLYDDDAKKDEQRDPEAFKVEKRAQWAEVIDAYLNPRMVERMFEPIRMPDGQVRKLGPQNAGKLIWTYRGHADPSESQANFAAAIGHTEPMPDPETGEVWAHVFIDWMQVWKPAHYADHQIPYDDIEHELADAIAAFTTLKTFSYDQYGGFITVPRMQTELTRRGHRARVKKEQFTAQSNQIRAERFKSALGMNWIHSYRDLFGNDGGSLLEDELKFLQVKNGKIVKQDIGPVTTKDLADCIMVVTSELVAEQLDRFERGRALRNSRIAPGAPGGYHTNLEIPPVPGTSRDNLRRFSNNRATGRNWRGVR